MSVPRKWIAITGHATNALPDGTCDGIYCGGAGNVVAKTKEGAADVTIPAVAGGYVLGNFTHVRATSTATGMFALYN